MNESEYYATEITDAQLDALADVGEFKLEEQGFFSILSQEDRQALMETRARDWIEYLRRGLQEEI
jgi:hypothetical protein